MNIHEAVLQTIAAFVYCNRQAAADCRQQAKVRNFHVPAGACATEFRALTPPIGRVPLKLFYDATRREIK